MFGPNIARERYTNYSLSVAAINSAGIGVFRESDVLSELYIYIIYDLILPFGHIMTPGYTIRGCTGVLGIKS